MMPARLASALLVVAAAVGSKAKGAVHDALQRTWDGGVQNHRRAGGINTVPAMFVQGYWFGNFTFGSAPNFPLLLDTASDDVTVVKGFYPQGPNGTDTGRPWHIVYGGTEALAGTVYLDQLGTIGPDQERLTIQQQGIGVSTAPPTPPVPGTPPYGVLGLANNGFGATNSTPWFHELCTEGRVDECRFGLAFKTDGTGTVTYGGVDYDAFDGELSTVPITNEWFVSGDAYINNQQFRTNASFWTDTGTSTLIMPMEDARKVFNMTGMRIREVPASPADFAHIEGVYDCNNPPNLTLALKTVQSTDLLLPILSEALVQSQSNGSCVSTIQGYNMTQLSTHLSDDDWLVGNVFHQGRYVDHNVAERTMGFAALK